MPKYLVAALLACGAIVSVQPVFADPAPVFDVDAIQDGYGDEGVDQDLPPPPAPSHRGIVPTRAPATQDDWTNDHREDYASFEQRMHRIEQQINYLQQKTGSARLDTLQAEIQSMRGELELMIRRLNKMEASQKTLYADLDKRLSTLAQSGVSSPASKTTASNKKTTSTKKTQSAKAKAKKQPNVEEEQEIYQTAYTLIKQKKYSEAVNALHRMLKKYPSGQFASNAHYWLGELYGLMNHNVKALQEFKVVVRHYPDSPRVSDAQLKIGLLYASESKWSEAKAAFKKVINRYPGTSSARLAQEQLKQIRAAGR